MGSEYVLDFYNRVTITFLPSSDSINPTNPGKLPNPNVGFKKNMPKKFFILLRKKLYLKKFLIFWNRARFDLLPKSVNDLG